MNHFCDGHVRFERYWLYCCLAVCMCVCVCVCVCKLCLCFVCVTPDWSQNLLKEQHFFSVVSFPSLLFLLVSEITQSQNTHAFFCWSISNSRGCVFAIIYIAHCRFSCVGVHSFLSLHWLYMQLPHLSNFFTSRSGWTRIEGIHLPYFGHLALIEFIEWKMLKIPKNGLVFGEHTA